MQNKEDIPTVAERVGNALASGDLRQKPGPCPLDKVGALGMVGISERLADAVFRLKYSNQHKSYEEALQGVYGLTRSLDVRQRWRLRRWRLHSMARTVLDYWLADICRTCNGVKFQVVTGSPHLSDRACRTCHGTGKMPMPWLRRPPEKPKGRRATHQRVKDWRDACRKIEEHNLRYRTLLVELEKCERVIGDKMIRRLADDALNLDAKAA
jgi:hypothetical protein